MKKQSIELKKVKDLSYGAVLKSQGYKLESIAWDGNVAWFVFLDDGTAESKLTAFINGDLKGNIKKFDEALKTLKQMLFSNNK
jgi:hypothetical protein